MNRKNSFAPAAFAILLVLQCLLLPAQAPQKVSYQSIIRNASGELVRSGTVGVRISILQGSDSGTEAYVETHSVVTNINGLATIEVGMGSPETGTFSAIDWGSNTYFLKVEADPSADGETSYAITGISEILSVPYALHAKTAETVTGTITETDPVFTAWDKSTDISITESQISDLKHFTNEDETDPVFGSSIASGITGTDTTNWNNKLDSYTETDPVYGSSVAGGITGTDTANWNNKLDSYTETDPRVPVGTQAGQMQYWNGSAWVVVAPTTNEGATLQMIGGVPTWVGGQIVVDVTNPITGEIWMDRNLGASLVATSSTDAASYGDLYQWGRAADGHQIRTSATTTTLSNSDTPGHGNFILSDSDVKYDWRSPQNDNLWQGVSGTNNPCPSGYRLPTNAEWEAERLSWSSNNAAGAFGSPLKLPMTGFRDFSTGSVWHAGYCSYWSSTVDSKWGGILYFENGDAIVDSNSRAHGYSVRCIKD